MKKFRCLITIIAISFILTISCQVKREKYFEEKKTLEELIHSTNLFIKELDRTDNRIAIGRAVVQYTEEIKRLKKDLWNLEKLCPDYLMDSGYKQAPAELRPLFKSFYNALKRLKAITEGKRAKFSQDKNLIKIFDELKEALYYY